MLQLAWTVQDDDVFGGTVAAAPFFVGGLHVFAHTFCRSDAPRHCSCADSLINNTGVITNLSNNRVRGRPPYMFVEFTVPPMSVSLALAVVLLYKLSS